MSNAEERNLYIQKQQRWLLFLRHCAKCQLPEQECQFGRSCRVGKELWQHILNCNVPQGQTCEYPRCHSSKDLLKHHQKCQNAECPICSPVKAYVRTLRAREQPDEMGPATPAHSAAPVAAQMAHWLEE